MKFTDAQLREFARGVILSCASDIDYVGVAEQHEEQWDGLTEADHEQIHRAVYDLASSATVTVTWPDQDGGES